MIQCKEKVLDGGSFRGFRGCSNPAVTKAGYCKVHDPQLKCVHVDEGTGNPDCSTIVTGTKYCKWHAESVQRHRIYAQAQAQCGTLAWLCLLYTSAALDIASLRTYPADRPPADGQG